MELKDVSGLGPAMEREQAGFAPALALLANEVRARLRSAGDLAQHLTLPELEVPAGLGQMLAAALALEEEAPGAAVLREHYLRFLPTLHIEHRLRRGGPEERVLRAPLDLSSFPVLGPAVHRLFSCFQDAGVPSASLFGTESADALLAACPDVLALYDRAFFGRYLPLLTAFPDDLRRIAQKLPAGRAAQAQVIDEHLAAPLIHELSHAARSRAALPLPYLDECVASHVGILALPGLAYPTPGCRALFAAPWLAQVGQALSRVVGQSALLRAHAGVLPWPQVLPPGLYDALLRVGWDEHRRRRAPHFLASNFSPTPWLKLFFLSAAGPSATALSLTDPHLTLAQLDALPFCDIPTGPEDPYDAQILHDALRATCLRATVGGHEGAFAVAAAPTTLRINLLTCQVESLSPAGAPAIPSPTYFFPPAVAARLRGRGLAGCVAEVHDLSALPELAARLLDHDQGGTPSFRCARYTFCPIAEKALP